MTDKNLFIRLQKYRLRPGKESKEDYFTEAFAHLLNQNNELAKVFIEVVRENQEDSRKCQLGNISLDKKIDVNPHPDIHIDLEIKWGDFHLLIENKLDSTLSKEQAKNYENACEKNGQRRWILITRDYEEFDARKGYNYCLGQLYWCTVYERFNRYYYEKENNKEWVNDPIGYYLLKQFREYMEEEGMALISIDKEDGDKVLRSLRILKQIDELLGDVKKVIEEYKITWDTPEGIGKINQDYRSIYFTSSKLYYCIQFDINVNGRKLTPAVYVQLDDYNEGKGCIENRRDPEYIKSLENEKEWTDGNPFKPCNDCHWLERVMDMNELYKERNAVKQRQKIKDFFGKTLRELAEKGLIDRK